MKQKLSIAAAVLVVVGVLAGSAAAASSPAVVTGGTSSVQQTSAVIKGTVNPNGSETTYAFDWGFTPAYGFASAPRLAGHGTAAVAVQATASGLTPGTVYHYRLIAVNQYGTTIGADHTFKTAGHPPPGVSTGPATQVSATAATLTGAVATNDALTSWMFQYGVSPSLGLQTYAQALPAGTASQPVAAGVAGLTPGTIFYYRLVAFHGPTSVTYGNVQVLMTLPSTRPVPIVHAATTPHRVGSRPFVFTTSGAVLLPGSIPSWAGCGGTVTVRYFLGPRVVGSTLAPVQANCAFAGQVAFARKPGRGPRRRIVRLYVFVRFAGNGYLTPTHARVKHVTLG